MKYSTLLLVLFMLGFAGCSDFLEESSLDEIRPSSIDDLMQIMVGEVYPLSNTVRSFQDFLTDDVECFGAQGQELMESPIENLYSRGITRCSMNGPGHMRELTRGRYITIKSWALTPYSNTWMK